MDEIHTTELLRNLGDILAELRRRGICRSENLPTGDLAEYLACKALGLSLAEKSAKGFDATDLDGLRYQVKGRRITQWNPSTQLSAIRELDASPFLSLAMGVSLVNQDREEFERLLERALAVDPDEDPSIRLSNVVSQRRAALLLDQADELFEEPLEEEEDER